MGPNFFIIGAPKCGTTSLADLLSKHDDVYFCPKKEPRFFSHDSIYQRGSNYYEELFSEADNQRRVGEGSTTYSEAFLNWDEKSARRIHQYHPSARIIYCVRHPLRRIQSHWLDFLWALDNNLMQDTPRYRSGELQMSGNFNQDVLANDGLVQTSNYWRVIQEYRNYFSDEQIHIVFLEDLASSSDAVLRKCCTFLHIDPDFDFTETDEPRNTSASKGLATTFGRIVRSLPGYRVLAGGAPSFLKTLVRPLIKDSFTEKPDWDPRVRDKVVSEIGGDVKSFLEYTGKPRDYWSLEE